MTLKYPLNHRSRQYSSIYTLSFIKQPESINLSYTIDGFSVSNAFYSSSPLVIVNIQFHVKMENLTILTAITIQLTCFTYFNLVDVLIK